MTPPIISSDDLADMVAAHHFPLIFLDTAAILDILRAPYRNTVQSDIIESAVATIEESIAIPKRIWAVTTANVLQEFRANRDSEQQELETRIAAMSQSVARMSRVASLVFPEHRIGQVDWLALPIPDRVLGIVDRLVSSMAIFRGTADCVGKARDRLWAGLPPASKSKEFKDCEIFEEFLEVVGILRDKGFVGPAIFVTPNKRDYGEPPSGYDRIASDLKAVRANYAANISWALGMLRVAAHDL